MSYVDSVNTVGVEVMKEWMIMAVKSSLRNCAI